MTLKKMVPLSQVKYSCDVCSSTGKRGVEADIGCVTCRKYLCHSHASIHMSEDRVNKHVLKGIVDYVEWSRMKEEGRMLHKPSPMKVPESDVYSQQQASVCSSHDGQVIRGFCNSCLIPVCGAW